VIEKQREQLVFVDKSEMKEGIYQAVIGVIKISHPSLFFCFLHQAVHEALETGEESLYRALSLYSQTTNVEPCLIPKEEWLDAGHLDRLDTHRRKMRARSFNSMEIDSRKGTVTKRSLNKGKLAEEINWYISLPDELKFYIPRIFSYSLDKQDPFALMEYYGYPSLADIFVGGNLNESQWGQIIRQLHWILGQFAEHTYEANAEYVYNAKRKMYVEKTRERLSSLLFTPELQAIAKGGEVNGREMMSLADCLERLDELFSFCVPYGSKRLTVMHGDFCLSNILYDARSKVFRLVDPRGSFGEVFIYGDPHYDIAKLSHSIRSFYDFIVRDQFYYYRDANNIIFQPYTYDWHNNLSRLFVEEFLVDAKTRRAVDFIEAMLFLSMVPLHADVEKRQVAMLLTGMEKFTSLWKVYEEEKILQKSGEMFDNYK
jgi:hypothetical protein